MPLAPCLVLASLPLVGPLPAQENPVDSRTEVLELDTGVVSNEGAHPETVAALYVFQEGAPWLRLSFDRVLLAGNRARGTGSFLRITSLLDGYQQLLDAKTVEEWGHTSAYFNGDLLLVELIAYPGTGPNRISLDEVTVGLLPPGVDSICGTGDDRQLSSDPRVARTLPIGCTSFLIDDDCGCFLTAGHCYSLTSVVEFNVPLSSAGGSFNHPPPSDQYSVDPSSMQTNGGLGVGNDWAYFGTFPNSTTGKTASEAQGAVFTFATPPAWNSSLNIRITGHGKDDGVNNQVQQTHVGPWLAYAPGQTVLSYQVDTQGGTSGSPVIQEENGTAIGINTHNGCTSTGGANQGTASTHDGLRAALANPTGVCKKVQPPMCSTAPVTAVRNGSGVNPICLANGTAPAIGTVWSYSVDPTVVPGGDYSVVRAQLPGPGITTSLGEILLDLSSRALFTTIRSGAAPHQHSIRIPANVELAGLQASIQAVVGVNGLLMQACNAIDFTVGCAP
ncbi:MAG TPA: hypothetical protein ENJ09_07470 [Planctomycetes bacterium]|nr:hypothetical protein [Planctomycetota bacterium]